MTTTRIRETERNEELNLEDVCDSLEKTTEKLNTYLNKELGYSGYKNLNSMIYYIKQQPIRFFDYALYPIWLETPYVDDDSRNYCTPSFAFIYENYLYVFYAHYTSLNSVYKYRLPKKNAFFSPIHLDSENRNTSFPALFEDFNFNRSYSSKYFIGYYGGNIFYGIHPDPNCYLYNGLEKYNIKTNTISKIEAYGNNKEIYKTLYKNKIVIYKDRKYFIYNVRLGTYIQEDNIGEFVKSDNNLHRKKLLGERILVSGFLKNENTPFKVEANVDNIEVKVRNRITGTFRTINITGVCTNKSYYFGQYTLIEILSDNTNEDKFYANVYLGLSGTNTSDSKSFVKSLDLDTGTVKNSEKGYPFNGASYRSITDKGRKEYLIATKDENTITIATNGKGAARVEADNKYIGVIVNGVYFSRNGEELI